MPSRVTKERKLKRNVEINTERAVRQYQDVERREIKPQEREEFRQMFEKSALDVDKNGTLDRIWNDQPGKASDISERPMFGYFGGVNFDKNGKIIRGD